MKLMEKYQNEFEVVHPLYDAPEQKFTGEELGLIKLTGSGKFSLILLRFYVLGMGCLLAYHLFTMIPHK